MRRLGSAAEGGRLARAGEFFPHFAPLQLTCGFACAMVPAGEFGLLTVEGCGVEWGAVE
jgi:hypothetical protein